MEKTNFTFLKLMRLSASLLMVLCTFSYVSEVSAQTGGISCAAAQAVTPGTYLTIDYDDTNTGSEASCAGSSFLAAGNGAAWYSFTATAAGTIDVASCGYGEDTNLSVYEGACGALTCVGGAGDNCTMGPGLSNFASEITGIPVCAGETYLIQWDDRWSPDPHNWDLVFTAATAGPANMSTIAPDGCTATITWVTCDATASVEICPAGTASGGTGCVVFAGSTSPLVVDLCAAGFASGTDVEIYITDGVGTGPATTLSLPPAPLMCAGMPADVLFSENFDAGGAMFGSACGWNIDSNGTGSGGTGPLTGSAPSAPNYLYLETSCTAVGLNFAIATVDLTCKTDAQLTYFWHFASTGPFGDNIVSTQVSPAGANTWTTIRTHLSGETPTQASPFTLELLALTPFVGQVIDIRFESTQDLRFEDFAVDDIMVLSCADACPAAIATVTAAAPAIVEIDCSNPSGSISAPATTGCPTGSTYEFSTDGTTWSTAPPAYSSTGPVTVFTRCSCDCDATGMTVSPITTTMTNPVILTPVANCSPGLTVTLVGGAASITTAMVNNGSTAACGPAAVSASPLTFTCADPNPTIVTLTVTDPVTGAMATCTTPVTLVSPAPTAVCNDATINVFGNTPVTMPGSTVAGGSSSACGDPILTVSPNMFSCENIGTTTVTVTAADPVTGASSECTAVVTIVGPKACLGSTPIENKGGPNIADPCTCDGVGGFDEEVIVHGIGAGEMWVVSAVSGLTYGSGGAPVMVGDLLTDLGNGDYSLVTNHLDGVGYSLEVTSPFFTSGGPLSISNKCYYPVPLFDFAIDTVACAFTDIIQLEGIGVSQKDGVTLVDGTTRFTVNGVAATELDPNALGVGSHTVEFCFDAGVALGTLNGTASDADAQDDPGCEACTTEIFVVLGTPSTVACNDRINVSLEGNCEALITPDMVLEGSYVCYDDYAVALKYNNTAVANPVDYSLAGQIITTEITHLPSGNKCWGELILEDKWAPQLNCDIDFLDKDGNQIEGVFDFNLGGTKTIFIPCTIDPADVPGPTATDNCAGTEVYIVSEEVVFEAACNVINNFTVTKRIIRTYGVKDVNGNEGTQCSIQIDIYQVPMQFPDDITWTCEQYAAHNNIVDATNLHPLILANIVDGDDDEVGVSPYEGYPNYSASSWWLDNEDLDVTLDPNWDDNIDNPLNDSSADCNTATTEVDSDDCKANFAGSYFNCDTNAGGHSPNIVRTPIHDRTLVDGLEDADVLALTGSGTPRTADQHEACKHSFTHVDQIAAACDGADITKTFKIIRTWTALNWCSGATTVDVQIIKVLDKTAPVIVFNDDDNQNGVADENEINPRVGNEGDIPGFGNNDGFNDLLVGNEYSTNGAHPMCVASGVIGAPTVTDNCSDIATVRVFTPVGEATPVTDNSGNVTGYEIPEPYLPVGIHDVTYEAIDHCGNVTRRIKQIKVEDGIVPTAICREITQVSLSTQSDGITDVLADYFNEASYDNCSPIYFKVLKAENETCNNANIDKYVEQNFAFQRSDGTATPGFFEFFDDDVKFCCEEKGTTVNIILRVYDVDPGPGAIPTNIFPNQANTGDYLGHINIPRGIRNNSSLDQSQFVNAQHLNGHYNDCTIEVKVEDKTRPVCVAPADVWINCSEVADNTSWDDDDAMNAQYGLATGYDNCSYVIENVSVNVDLDLCGVGTVTRTFRTVDCSDNRSVGRCRQMIMIQPVTEYCITFPADFEGECDNSFSPAELTYDEIGCDLIAVNRERLDFFAGGPDGECKKEIYTWQVINWCEYDGISAPIVMSRNGDNDARNIVDSGEYCSNGRTLNHVTKNISYTSTGFYQWEQHVKIYDNTAPEVSYDGDVEFCGGDLDEDPCTGQVDISIDITELCTDQITTTWAISANSDTFVSADIDGGGNISMRLPLGTHTARFQVADDCGNVSQLDITFTIIDCKAPTPVCYNGLSVDLMPTGMVAVWASDFDASSFDYCHDFEVTANVVTDRVRDGVINSADYMTTRPTTTEVMLDCNHVGTITYIQLWVHELSGDGVNDDDYCVTYIEVQDNNDVCGVSRASIAGNIADEKGTNIENVDVNLSVDMTANFMTTADGNYSFAVNEGGDYTVTPMKTDDVRNGVSTFDLALISKHILNVAPLNSPYKIIAADANNSGSVSTLDLVAIRKLVLFVANDFPNNTSWRFVDKDYVFANPQNPFASVFPEVRNFNNITGTNMADFVAVKVGDVSGDAGFSSVDDRSFNGTFELNTEDNSFEAGEEVRVAVDANLNSIDGFQATLNFNTKAVELLDIESATLTGENFGTTMTADGIITMSWNGEATSNEAFTLVFTAKAAGTVSDILSVSSAYTEAEAYVATDYLNVGMNFGGTSVAQVFSLHQNTPNPFASETTIGFELPKADAATLTISDLSGKVLRVIKGNYEAGHNSVVVQMTNNLPMGVLIYELETSTDKATKKMTIVK